MHDTFSKVARLIVAGAASAYTTMTAMMLVGVWIAWGPFVGFSDTWQLWANTVTTIVTNLLAFLILHEQSRDTAAIHAKLDELIASSRASNRYIAIERLTDSEISELRQQIDQRS